MQKLLCPGPPFRARTPSQEYGNRLGGFCRKLFWFLHTFPVARSSWSTSYIWRTWLKSFFYSLPKQRLYSGKGSLNALRCCIWKSWAAADSVKRLAKQQCPQIPECSRSCSCGFRLCAASPGLAPRHSRARTYQSCRKPFVSLTLFSHRNWTAEHTAFTSN